MTTTTRPRLAGARRGARRAIIVAAVPALMIAGAAAPAQATADWAGSPNPAPADGSVLTKEQALTQDAAALAKQEGVSTAVMRERLQFQAAVDEIRESWPAAVREGPYAGGRMDHSGAAPGAVLYFKGTVPPVVRSQLAESSLAGVTLQGGQRFSWSELVERQNEVHQAVVDLGFEEVFSTVDVASQQIEVEVVRQPERASLQGAKLRQEIVAAVARKPASAGAELRADELEIIERPAGSSVVDLNHSYGGAGMRDDGVFECTSGFAAERTSDSVDGMLTAGHCAGLNQIDQNNTSGGVDLTYSAPFQNQHVGVLGDAEWHTTSHIELPEFWSSDTFRRTVSGTISVANIDEGDFTCHYGRTSGYSCGNVSDANSSGTFTWSECGCQVTVSNMVDVAGATSAGGDSGGPWFLVFDAWGIHHGQRISNGDQVFTKIQFAELILGVSVMTG